MQNSLRPKNFNEFIGQDKLKETLKVIINSSIKRKKQLDHILFYGNAGFGKTSLAHIVANILNKKIRFVQGPLLEKKSDVLSLFCSIQSGDLIFIDEIHGINKKIEEIFYSALEDNSIDIFIGPEGDQKLVRMKLPNFSLIGATTLFSKVSQPLKDRFGYIAKFDSYSLKNIYKIIRNSSKKLKIKIDKESIEKISLYSRNIPRIANNLLKRTWDFAIDSNDKKVSLKIVDKTFKSIGLYKNGLNDMHVNYLKNLYNNFNQKFVSLNLVLGFLNEEKNNVEKEIEPILISLDLITKNSKGRKITEKGINYLSNYFI